MEAGSHCEISIGDHNEITVACSTPRKRKRSALQDKLIWPTSPVSKISSPAFRPTSASMPVKPDHSGCQFVLVSSDEELILPARKSTKKRKKPDKMLVKFASSVKEIFQVTRLSPGKEDQGMSHSRSAARSKSIVKPHNASLVAETPNVDGLQSLNAKRKLQFLLSPNTSLIDEPIITPKKSSVTSKDDSIKDQVVNKNNKTKTKGISTKKEDTDRRKSGRARATPTAYWTGESPRFLSTDPVQHPRVTSLKAVSASKPEKRAAQKKDISSARKKKSSSPASTSITDKHSVTWSVFGEAAFEHIGKFQHAITMDVFGLSTGFYRLPPGTDTGTIKCDQDSQLYTVLQGVIEFEVDGCLKALKCYDQLHVLKGVSHKLSNKSNDIGLLQYTNINDK